MGGETPAAPYGEGPFEPLKGSLKFACHPGVTCFNECCADLKLVLTPYDILRLKNRLGLTSGQFLERHTEDESGPVGRFPRVILKMTAQPGRPCPFVTEQGCSVYEDRPGACRIYPLGRGAASGGREIYFVVREAHCRGFSQDRTWEVNEWLADQGLERYNEINDKWMEIITSRSSLGPEEHMVKKIQMFSMVSYNLDRFRDFVFKSRFLQMFEVDQTRIEAMETDDAALLEFGFDWLRFALFGEKTIQPR